MLPRTNFARYSHLQLYQMLHDGDEATARSAADSWDAVGARMHEQAGNLETGLAAFRQQWQGGAAEQYQLMIGDLSAGLRRIGDAMFAMRDIAHDAADSLVRAKVLMPPPVTVPNVSPATVYLATATLEVDPLASTQDMALLRRRQADAVAALASHQQAVDVSNSVHARAIAVMNNLAVDYLVAGDAIPVAPAASPGTVVPAAGPNSQWDGLVAEEQETGGKNGSPVFGFMFTAGIAAAAAATAGRLGMRILPKVPGWAKKQDKAKEEPVKDELAKDELAAIAPAVGTGALSTGLGGGGGKFGGIGGGGGGFSAPVPTAHVGMVGSSAGPAAAALGAAAGAAGAGGAMTPMMPMMPFAPMGAGGASARRIPPWLTETEDVWGESAVITPPVLGENPPQDRRGFPY